jgi:hypothetical protein
MEFNGIQWNVVVLYDPLDPSDSVRFSLQTARCWLVDWLVGWLIGWFTVYACVDLDMCVLDIAE